MFRANLDIEIVVRRRADYVVHAPVLVGKGLVLDSDVVGVHRGQHVTHPNLYYGKGHSVMIEPAAQVDPELSGRGHTDGRSANGPFANGFPGAKNQVRKAVLEHTIKLRRIFC